MKRSQSNVIFYADLKSVLEIKKYWEWVIWEFLLDLQ